MFKITNKRLALTVSGLFWGSAACIALPFMSARADVWADISLKARGSRVEIGIGSIEDDVSALQASLVIEAADPSEIPEPSFKFNAASEGLDAETVSHYDGDTGRLTFYIAGSPRKDLDLEGVTVGGTLTIDTDEKLQVSLLELKIVSDNGVRTVNASGTVSVLINEDGSYSGGSHGSGGGRGGSSTVIVTGGSTSSKDVPRKMVSGTWSKDESGRWTFNNNAYKDTWVYAYNPYAKEGEPQADWFRFDKDGWMQTGWIVDIDGQWYYLNESHDSGTFGKMLTGWQWINGKCYYFQPTSEGPGSMGSLYRNATTPDGYTVGPDGAWTISGKAVVRAE